MKFLTFTDAEYDIFFENTRLKWVEYPEEQAARFLEQAKEFSYLWDYYYDDGDDFVSSGKTTYSFEPNSLVIRGGDLVGFYIENNTYPLHIRCILMLDGSIIGKAEDEAGFAEASDTVIHMAYRKYVYSLQKKA